MQKFVKIYINNRPIEQQRLNQFFGEQGVQI